MKMQLLLNGAQDWPEKQSGQTVFKLLHAAPNLFSKIISSTQVCDLSHAKLSS